MHYTKNQRVNKNAEAKGTPDTDYTSHLNSVLFTLENYSCLQVSGAKMFFLKSYNRFICLKKL